MPLMHLNYAISMIFLNVENISMQSFTQFLQVYRSLDVLRVPGYLFIEHLHIHSNRK